MLFGVGTCILSFFVLCIAQFVVYYLNVNYLGEERAVFSAIVYSYRYCFCSSSWCLGTAALFSVLSWFSIFLFVDCITVQT